MDKPARADSLCAPNWSKGPQPKMTTAFFSVLASVLVVQGTTTEPALQPVSQWSVTRAPSTCVLSRDFGSGKNRLTLSIEPELLSGTITVTVDITDADRKTLTEGETKLKIGTYEVVKAFNVSRSARTKTKKISFNISSKELEIIASSSTMTVPIKTDLSATIVLESAPNALQALDTCRTDTLKSWSVDSVSASTIVKRPGAIKPENWVQNRDYPEEALRKSIQGITELILTIGSDGRITDCRIVKTSGYDTLDRASCTALARPTHRFTPAENAAGQPVIGWTWVSQRWHLPT